MSNRAVTVSGIVVSGPEYEETEQGKHAWIALSVVTKRRVADEWIDDPAVVYHVLVRDADGLAIVASLPPTDGRLLVSGTITSEVPLVLEADGLVPSVTYRDRG